MSYEIGQDRVLSSADSIASIAAAPGEDTHTISIPAGSFARWYGTQVSAEPAAGDLTLEITISIGATVAAIVLFPVDNQVNGQPMFVSIGPGGRKYLEGADGEDITILIDNPSASATGDIRTITYYSEHSVKQPSEL